MSFLNGLKKFGNKICLIDNHETISYKSLIELSNNLVSNFEKRSLVFLVGENNIETIITYVGLIRSKSVAVLLQKNIKKKNSR